MAAVVFVKEPLKSSRPVGSGTELNGATNELRVRARLWEDPFAIVQKDFESRKKSGQVIIREGKVSLSGTVNSLGQSAVAEMTMKTVANESTDDGFRRLQDTIWDSPTIADDQITALIVMTAGGPYANNVEARINDRYAVGAALEVGCFAPNSTDFLYYFTWQFKAHDVETPYEWYEYNKTARCGDSGKKDERVLVLWVIGEDYQDEIMKGINALIEQILRDVTPEPAEAPSTSQYCRSMKSKGGEEKRSCKRVIFKVVGPWYSSELESMLREIQIEPVKGKEQLWQKNNGKLELYSPWATAMPGLLSYGMKEKKGTTAEKDKNEVACDSYATCMKVFTDRLSEAHIDVQYSINSDKVLFESLFQELDRRQVTIGEDPIVLIGEWDSFYARALPITFSAAACHYITDRNIRKSYPPSDHLMNTLNGKCTTTEDGVNALMNGEISPRDMNIKRYSYLSGLDGESLEDQQKRPKAKSEDKEKEQLDGGKLKLRNIASYEKPEGTSQLDYVRRLVSRIKSEEHDKSKGHDDHYRKVKAIGILGRDAYDALLILQAVREEFPTVLFFATDLYARYFHESEQKWARNLLVVSHFGLQLDPQLQRAIPPFRDTYQTSTFLAVLRAIDRIAHHTQQGECQNARPTCYALRGSPREIVEYSTEIAPRLFEIGRHGAVDLSVNTIPIGMKSVHPARNDVESDARTVKIPEGLERLWIVLLTIFFVSVWSYGRLWNWVTAREETDNKKRTCKRLLRTAPLVFLVLCLFILWSGVHGFDYEGDEPFSWSDGVSIWPTELLRLMAGLLSICFMLKARADLADNTQALTSRFFPNHNGEVVVINGFWEKLTIFWRNIGRKNFNAFWQDLNWIVHGSEYGKPWTAADVWTRYRQAHTCSQRAGRIILLIVLYFIIIWSTAPILNDGQWGLFVPCRGAISCRADGIVLFLSVVPFIILNLSVLDAVLLCTRWISEKSLSSGLSEVEKVRLIGERTRIVNRRVLYPFVVLFIIIAARNHYFDHWDFPPVLIMVLTVNSLVALASASLLYLAAVGTKRTVLASIQEKLDRALTQDENKPLKPVKSSPGPSSDRLRQIISEINSIQQGAFVPFYQQPVVQATLLAALAFLQYWYLGQ
ncbi:MAG: hypothetical protein HY348_11950 [Nitrospira defluvii]|nr:hypothetical protein [Nitrospira defluvii]